MIQIEPVEIFDCENNAVCFKVYDCINNLYIFRVEMLDDVDCVLFITYITAKTIDDVAKKLGLKVKNY